MMKIRGVAYKRSTSTTAMAKLSRWKKGSIRPECSGMMLPTITPKIWENARPSPDPVLLSVRFGSTSGYDLLLWLDHLWRIRGQAKRRRSNRITASTIQRQCRSVRQSSSHHFRFLRLASIYKVGAHHFGHLRSLLHSLHSNNG